MFSLRENVRDCTPYAPEGGAENFVGFEAGRILKEGGFADSASLSRILAELLGGTRSSPPEAPSQNVDRAYVIKNKAFKYLYNVNAGNCCANREIR